MVMVDILSSQSLIGPGLSAPTLAGKLLSQNISFAAVATTTYSASVLDWATRVCLFNNQLTAPHPIHMMKPEIEWRSGCKAQSTSEKTLGWVPTPPSVSHRFFVVLRYLIKCFNAS